MIIYNPTNSNRQAKILPQKEFKLLKHTNEYKASVTGLHGGVKASLSPDGCVTIDFGLVD